MAHPGGRPTKYSSDMCEKVIEYMSQGDSKTAVAAKLDISKETLYEWVNTIPEFSYALKKGMNLCQQWWEDLGKEVILQGQGNAAVWIFNMKNRFRDDWSDITRTELTGPQGEPIGIIGYSDYDSAQLRSEKSKRSSPSGIAASGAISSFELASQSQKNDGSNQ